MPNVSMNKNQAGKDKTLLACANCGAETELYVNRVPLCLACVNQSDHGNSLPTWPLFASIR